MRTTLLRLAAAALVVSAGGGARADQPGFATANVQVLQAWNMDDVNNNPASGDQTVVTFNYFGTWDYGDLNFFADFNRARGPKDGDAWAYGEVAPRLMVGKLFGLQIPGIVDFGPAFELNHGGNFYAYLAGLGGNLALPAPYVLGLNVYYRYDKFVKNTAQATVFWGAPFQVGPAGFAFKGFADFTKGENFAGTESGLDLMTQPQLLVDVGGFFGKPNRYWLGTEYWLHLHPERDTHAVQAMLEWTLR